MPTLQTIDLYFEKLPMKLIKRFIQLILINCQSVKKKLQEPYDLMNSLKLFLRNSISYHALFFANKTKKNTWTL